MAKTRHIQQRMSQRGIKQSTLAIVEQFGTWCGDKQILNQKACEAALRELDRIRHELIKAKERGGYVLVEAGGVEVTTYALDSYSRKKCIH
ncbi:hypothetical protein ACOI2Q_20520 [Shewanella algae]|uniref:hypothetical protein n=1 Tax=Shewanella TaxID=22 RepID=UPI001F4134EC|nr:hypothetical protein [Shewanella chilikensis]MCE9854363.1 hypothetical protein [Shewanella chilikensis]